MTRILTLAICLMAARLYAANPSFTSFIGSNGVTVTSAGTGANQKLIIGAPFGVSPWTNASGIVRTVSPTLPVLVDASLSLGGNSVLLTLGTNTITVAGHSDIRLISPTNDASQVIVQLTAPTTPGDQLLFVSNYDTNTAWTMYNAQVLAGGGTTKLQGNFIANTSGKGLLLAWSVNAWEERARYSPGGGNTNIQDLIWTSVLGILRPNGQGPNTNAFSIYPSGQVVIGTNTQPFFVTIPTGASLLSVRSTGWGEPNFNEILVGVEDSTDSSNTNLSAFDTFGNVDAWTTVQNVITNGNTATEIDFDTTTTSAAITIKNGSTIIFKTPLTNAVAGQVFTSDGAGVGYWGPAGGFNPTLNYIPYKNGAASFGDSPWYFISSEKMGFNGTVQTVFLDTLGNVAFGRYTMPGAVTGSNNTSFGQSALGYLTSGNRNTAYGFGAASNLLSGNDVTAWGWNAQPQAAIDTNEVVVGSGALGNGPNTATIGDLNMRTIYFQNSASNNVEIKLTNAAGSLRVYIDTNNVGHFTARNIDVDATLGNLRLLTGSSQWNFSDNIVTPGTSNTYSLGTLLFPFKDLYVGTNSIYLGTNVLSAVPASLVYNGYPIQPTSTKAAFITNYTASTSENVLFCTGTNQVITLPSAASVPTGWMFTIIAATTTGSVIVTNSTGAQTILGGLSQTVTSTNRLTIVSNGSHYW